MGAETKNESEMTRSWLLLMVGGCRDKSKAHQQVKKTCWWWLWSSVLRQRCWEVPRLLLTSQPSPTKKVRCPEFVRGGHWMSFFKVKMIGK